MIRCVVYLLRIFKMFHGLMNNPVLFIRHFYYDMLVKVTQKPNVVAADFIVSPSPRPISSTSLPIKHLSISVVVETR
jgi:hypothetical protein